MARKHKLRRDSEEMPAEQDIEESKEVHKGHSEKLEKAPKSKTFDTIALFMVGLVIGLVIGGLVFYAMGSGESKTGVTDVELKATGQKAVEFITGNLISEGYSVNLVNISEVGKTGVYKMTVNLSSGAMSQLVESYTTKDVEVLCPSGIVVADFLEEQANAANTTTEEETPPATPEEACAKQPKAEKPVLEAYVVSRCPYGLQMQRIMAEVVKQAPEAAQYMKVRYIGSIEDGKITAMHGDNEAQENLRQICIREEQADKYWAYIGCFMKADGKSSECLDTAKVDKAKLDTCMNDSKKGLEYAKTDFDRSDGFGVTGSPTMIMNEKKVSEFDFAINGTSGRSAEAVKNLLCCGFNTKPAFCTKTISTAQAATMFSAEYGGSGSSGSC